MYLCSNLCGVLSTVYACGVHTFVHVHSCTSLYEVHMCMCMQTPVVLVCALSVSSTNLRVLLLKLTVEGFKLTVSSVNGPLLLGCCDLEVKERW